MINTQLPTVSVSVAELRTAIASEACALRELLQTVEEERDALDVPLSESRENHSKQRKLVTALTHLGGDDILRARLEAAQALEHLYQIAAEIDKHNDELAKMSFWKLVFRRRQMLRRVRVLERKRRQAMAQCEATKKHADQLLLSLATPENISEVIRVSRQMRGRFRDAANKRKQLSIRRRLLSDNINLCQEIDGLLSLLDAREKISVHESDLQTLMRDQVFQSSLRDRARQDQG
ncbi:hypothetical protein [Litorivivens sp.]|uniref:hypothetical protein n=2 Tax=Litorivivens sp. TaxID=2020868 RepID=UPI00356637B0